MDFIRVNGLMAEARTALARGDTVAAVRLLEQARQAGPGVAEVPAMLADIQTRRGDLMAALEQRLRAFRLANRRATRQPLARLLARIRLEDASDAVRACLADLLGANDIDPQAVAAALLPLLRSSHDWPAIEAMEFFGAAESLSRDRLLLAVLTRALLPDEGMEQSLTRLRARMLWACSDHMDDADDRPGRDPPPFMVALAGQAMLAEHCWSVSPAEWERLDRLSRRSEKTRNINDLIVIASFRPLSTDEAGAAIHSISACGHASAQPHANLLAILREGLPLDGGEAAEIPHFGGHHAGPDGASDDVARRVRQQYETAPYPRWTGTFLSDAQPLSAILGTLFPDHRATSAAARTPLRVLVAGCGTGAHAARVAARYAAAQVTAIDLSARAVAFARRRARELGLRNIVLAVGDLRDLGDVDAGPFDLIECGGVLHHMAEPLAGWRALKAALAPGGYMKIGLYSRRARADIHRVQAWLRERGFEPSLDDIRKAREAMRASDPGTPMRMLTRELEFYCRSGFRDMLMPAQEHVFDPDRIESHLRTLDLTYLGFEIADESIRRSAGKAGLQPTSPLSAWDRWEEANPTAFRTMYQFWCYDAGCDRNEGKADLR